MATTSAWLSHHHGPCFVLCLFPGPCCLLQATRQRCFRPALQKLQQGGNILSGIGYDQWTIASCLNNFLVYVSSYLQVRCLKVQKVRESIHTLGHLSATFKHCNIPDLPAQNPQQ